MPRYNAWTVKPNVNGCKTVEQHGAHTNVVVVVLVILVVVVVDVVVVVVLHESC